MHDEVVFVDAGSNAERIGCPACGAALGEEWWAGRVERAAATGYSRLAVTTPCCGTRTTLNDLDHVWPAGFARAELVVSVPRRGWLTEEELQQVAAALGHDVREVRTGALSRVSPAAGELVQVCAPAASSVRPSTVLIG